MVMVMTMDTEMDIGNNTPRCFSELTLINTIEYSKTVLDVFRLLKL